jgi:cell shape-determining protein MreC
MVTSTETVEPAVHERVLQEKQAMEGVAASLSAKVSEMQREIDLLTASRLWTIDGMQLGAQGRLVPAQVLGEDLLTWRDSAWIDVGGNHRIAEGAAVVSRSLQIAAPEPGAMRDGLAVLLGESLVGWVRGVGTHSARVQLLSDPGSKMKVRIGRIRGGQFEGPEFFFWLVGAGEGEMRVGDVAREQVSKGIVAVGDLVLSDPMLGALPAPMVVGKVVAIGADRENPLLAILNVASTVNLTRLQRVYVYDPRVAAGN